MDLEQRFRVPPQGFRLADRDPADVAGLDKEDGERLLDRSRERLAELQERLFAERERALLVVLQALDAAGKDGTIKHVLDGVNPAGVTVTSFRQPTATELAHDFLWRAQLALPERGRIGVFNRSHYEDVLVVRVHDGRDEQFWKRRFEDIAAWERHLTHEGTRVVKLFLHVSKDEQRRRFLARADEERKMWKFSAGDVRERRHWDAYQRAYEDALRHTSTADEPWYVVPADHKWFLRAAVGAILVHHLEAMDPQFPEPSPEAIAEMEAAVGELRAEG